MDTENMPCPLTLRKSRRHRAPHGLQCYASGCIAIMVVPATGEEVHGHQPENKRTSVTGVVSGRGGQVYWRRVPLLASFVMATHKEMKDTAVWKAEPETLLELLDSCSLNFLQDDAFASRDKALFVRAEGHIRHATW